MKKTVGYVRVSTSKQTSIAFQTDVIQKIAKKNNWMISEVYQDTASGGKIDRTGLQHMLQAIQKNEIERVIVFRLNRLGRSVKDLLVIGELLSEKKVALFSLMEPMLTTTTSLGKLNYEMISSLAELERALIQENQTISYQQKWSKGEPLSATAPFGYRYEHRTLHVQKWEAELVMEVFQRYMRGEGYKRISSQMQGKIPSSTPANIRNMLCNETYTGFLVSKRFGRVKGNFESIISTDDFQQVQQIRQGKQQASAVLRYPFLLRRKIACPFCGTALACRSRKSGQNTYGYYYCAKAENSHKEVCRGISISAKVVEAEVVEALQEWLSKKIVPKYLKDVEEGISIDADSQKKTDKAQLLRAFSTNQIDAATLQRKLLALQSQDDTIKERGKACLQPADKPLFFTWVAQAWSLDTIQSPVFTKLLHHAISSVEVSPNKITLKMKMLDSSIIHIKGKGGKPHATKSN
ncbi:recombinase family protein [Listeria booriae]|uniref:recombinase family protein n=1 Tax=Listeria booriae TaxID=1552123 RepID=UPI0016232E6D|nr:recombinase family protein [Listeria booriae]MBC1233556.1 recombinase family protein [Listeria booriae]MBC1245876.1 recombinase family protein [Listeria booriae]MBC1273373.1 recombinase family protein [Listeria booriae]